MDPNQEQILHDNRKEILYFSRLPKTYRGASALLDLKNVSSESLGLVSFQFKPMA